MDHGNTNDKAIEITTKQITKKEKQEKEQGEKNLKLPICSEKYTR